jgi:quinol-cytochrome oxidoreductase complex cytochrome b subunit
MIMSAPANLDLVFFVTGIIAMGYFVAALFFLRFWKGTRDKLFAIFAMAFVILALQQLGIAILGKPTEKHTLLYIPRLLAFLLIIYAIIDKNRKRTKP